MIVAWSNLSLKASLCCACQTSLISCKLSQNPDVVPSTSDSNRAVSTVKPRRLPQSSLTVFDSVAVLAILVQPNNSE